MNTPAYGYFAHAAEYAGVGILTSPMLKKAAGIIQKYNLWVVSDEIHCDLIRCGHRHIPMAKVMTDAIEKHNSKLTETGGALSSSDFYHLMKFVNTTSSFSGRPNCSLPSAMLFIRNTMLRAT